MTNEILAIDLSEHRAGLTRAEFRVLHEGGCRALGVRVSIAHSESGDLHADATAAQYVAWARGFGWVAYGYCYLNPRVGMRYDADTDGDAQGRFYAKIAAPLDLDGHYLDVEESGVKRAHIVYAVAAMRQGLRSERVAAVNLYSSLAVMKRFPDLPGIFDGGTWYANYGIASAARSLDDWATPPDREQYRDARLHQFGGLQYVRPNHRKRSVDGNVFFGTQQQLLGYMTADATFLP